VQGAVTVYSSEASFTSTAGTPSNKTTFESIPPGKQGQTLVDRGYIEDTAYDNVAIGPLVANVPESVSWELMLAGFGLVGSVLRW
jgi:hypothetical protein